MSALLCSLLGGERAGVVSHGGWATRWTTWGRARLYWPARLGDEIYKSRIRRRSPTQPVVQAAQTRRPDRAPMLFAARPCHACLSRLAGPAHGRAQGSPGRGVHKAARYVAQTLQRRASPRVVGKNSRPARQTLAARRRGLASGGPWQPEAATLAARAGPAAGAAMASWPGSTGVRPA